MMMRLGLPAGALVLAVAVLCAAQPPAIDVTTGRTVFHEKGCEHCHGADLHGTEKGPDLTGVGRRLSREQIQHQIHDGGENMPAFGDVLDPDEEAAVVKFLTTLRAKTRTRRAAPAKAAAAGQ